MCGIVGSLSFNNSSFKVTAPYITEMRDTMVHRGPDGAGTWVSENHKFGLGHRRLSIIDLSSNGNQPMINNKHVLAYNGEIYNFLEIKRNLELKGIKFRSNSDTEVLLKYWQTFNNSCLNHLDGMFAFAIVDKLGISLVLVSPGNHIKAILLSGISKPTD